LASYRTGSNKAIKKTRVTQTEGKRSEVRSEELKWKRQGEMGCSLCIFKEAAGGKKKRKKNA
jgi:hypothetical protein